jgi:hypothetical protein
VSNDRIDISDHQWIISARGHLHDIGATMPFSRYGADPGLMDAMKEAFRRVCKALRLNCAVEDPMTEIVVLKIVELAKAGESEPERLCAGVLAQLQMRTVEATGSPDVAVTPTAPTPG